MEGLVDMFNLFDTVPDCRKQTDGRRDGRIANAFINKCGPVRKKPLPFRGLSLRTELHYHFWFPFFRFVFKIKLTKLKQLSALAFKF